MHSSMLQIAAGLVLGVFPTVLSSQSLPASPATQPVEQLAARADGTRILVLAFAPVQASDADWISRAVQQSVVADLSRPTTGQPLQAISDSTPVNSTNDAIEAGKKASAKYVVTGNYQMVEPNLKVTGQVIDVETGKVVGGLKSTGSVRELFDMQDRIAGQVRFSIANERMAGKKQQTAVASLPKNPEAPPTIEPLGPVVAVQRPYDDSDLSRAVADDVSLIDRYDAAGQSYRQRYYDDSYYGSYPYYGGYGYGSYYNFNYCFNRWYRPYPCRPYKDSPHGGHGHHCDDRSDASTDPNDLTHKNDITHQNDVTHASPFASSDFSTQHRDEVVSHLNGPIAMTMQGMGNTNYVKNSAKNVTPQSGNDVASRNQSFNASPIRNDGHTPPSTMQKVPANRVSGSSNAVRAPHQVAGTAK